MLRGNLLIRAIVSIAAGIGLILAQGCNTNDVVIPPKGEGEWNDKTTEKNELEHGAWSINMGDFFFDPPDATVEAGSTITWFNNGGEAHTVTADDGSFDSGVLNPGDSFPVAFGGQGIVTYHCAIHPSMVGSITVGGGGDATPGDT